MDEHDVAYIKNELQKIIDMLFDEHVDTALYNLGYLMHFIDLKYENMPESTLCERENKK